MLEKSASCGILSPFLVELAMRKFIIFLLFAVFVLVNCSRMQKRQPVDVSAQAEDYVESGMQAVEEGNWKEAALSFNQAIRLDADYAEAYAGIALVLAERRQFHKAVEYAEKAIQKDTRSPQAYTAKGRVLLMMQKPDQMAAALQAFDKALQLDPNNDDALFFKAQTLAWQEKYDEAAKLLTVLASQPGRYKNKATRQLAFLRRLQQASPKTPIGKKMVNVEAMTRADLAALLVEELDLPTLVNRRNPNLYGPAYKSVKQAEQKKSDRAAAITDIQGHWAESWIREVVRLGAMDIFPDKSFRPDEKVRRMDFALTMQQVIILVTGNRSLDTAFIGMPSQFPDVKKSHYAFNAVTLCVERGIMAPDPQTGEFRLNDDVSGVDALISLRKLQAILNETS